MNNSETKYETEEETIASGTPAFPGNAPALTYFIPQ